MTQQEIEGEWSWWLAGGKTARAVKHNEQAAKDAAQADYERRIRNTLEDPKAAQDG